MYHQVRFLLILFCCFQFSCSSQVSGSGFGELPSTFEPGRIDRNNKFTGMSSNVRWAVPIGVQTYATPVIAGGKVLIGTLNDAEWDKQRGGSRSVLLCFDEKSGDFLWQLPLPKDYRISGMFDAFCVGISSTPTVTGDSVFLVTGRGEALCLDLNGLANGNTGPYTDEDLLYTFGATNRGRVTGRPNNVLPLSATDADIIWRYDMFGELNAMPHDTNNSDVLLYDGLLVINTGNAPDHTHVRVLYPEAPSLIIMDAQRGIPLARDDFNIGSDISHGQWCSPAIGVIDGKKMIFYGGGNGVLHAVEAPCRKSLWEQHEANGGKLVRLETVWTFHGDPRAHSGSDAVPPFVMGRGSPSYTSLPAPTLDTEGRIFMLFGHDAWNGARPFRSWLTCIDAKTGKLIWGTPNIEGGAITQAVTEDGLVYIADRRGYFYCFDASTGVERWRLRLQGDIWARPLLADGKIYIGTNQSMFYVLKAGLKPEIISAIKMPGPIFAPAAASGNTLFVAGDGFLYAIEEKN